MRFRPQMGGAEFRADRREGRHEVQDRTQYRLPGVRAPVRQDTSLGPRAGAKAAAGVGEVGVFFGEAEAEEVFALAAAGAEEG